MKQPFSTLEWMDGPLPYYIPSLHIDATKKKANCRAVDGMAGEETNCWQQSDCNPSVSEKSTNVFVHPTTVNTKKKKRSFVGKKKNSHDEDFVTDFNFLCENWPVLMLTVYRNNDLCLSLTHFSCAAGYDICARRVGMEGVSHKWGKEVNFWFFFFPSICPL